MYVSRFSYLWNSTVKEGLSQLAGFLRQAGGYGAWLFGLAPWLVRVAVYILLALAAAGILASHFLGIYKNRGVWRRQPQSGLTYSYFCGTGPMRRRLSYQEAHKLLRDRSWSWVSLAGLAWRLGNLTHESQLLLALCSLLYLPLAFLGFFEMVFRVALGTVWLLAASLVHRLLLFVLRLVSYLLIPLWQIADKLGRVDQHCPHCYETFNLPAFQCPGCGKIHKQLIPGRCGILVARCECGRFLPGSLYTGRSKMQAVCPACQGPLFAANARPLSFQLIGGSSSGKTAFLRPRRLCRKTAGQIRQSGR
jgi:hypothetical protein